MLFQEGLRHSANIGEKGAFSDAVFKQTGQRLSSEQLKDIRNRVNQWEDLRWENRPHISIKWPKFTASRDSFGSRSWACWPVRLGVLGLELSEVEFGEPSKDKKEGSVKLGFTCFKHS